MDITSLEQMIHNGRDSAMLRLALARLLSAAGRLPEAVEHLQSATSQDASYTAAWKSLGRAHLDQGDRQQAMEAWRTGLDVARRNGDKQAEREMAVFVKRLEQDP